MKKDFLIVVTFDGKSTYKTYTDDDMIDGKHLCYEVDKDTLQELVPSVKVMVHGSKIYAKGKSR